MKKVLRAMLIGLTVLLVAVIGLATFVRLAPSDPAEWNTPIDIAAFADGAPEGTVLPLSGGAVLWLGPARGDPETLLARLDSIALATPRTTRLAGTPDQRRITWQTRTVLWGFPDYTTAEARADGLYIHARQRFGREDLGVNTKRLTDWLARL